MLRHRRIDGHAADRIPLHPLGNGGEIKHAAAMIVAGMVVIVVRVIGVAHRRDIRSGISWMALTYIPP